MSPEKQRIKIAEACGWRRIDDDPNRHPYYLAPKGDWRHGHPLDAGLGSILFPDYLNDLNAMHKAEETLSEEKRPDYVNNLYLVAIAHQARTGKWRYSSLSASQRAEAFLKTLNLWEDDA